MKASKLQWVAIATALQGCVEGKPRFGPDDGGLSYQDYLAPMASMWNVSDTQSVLTDVAGNSFWSSSFIHGSDDHEYMVISHVIAGTNLNIYRASVLDITDPSYFKQFTEFYEGSIRRNSADLNFVFDDFQYRLVNADRLGRMTTSSQHGDVLFNITFDLSSSAMLLNAGAGTFQWGQNGSNTNSNEWSVPAARTAGYLQKANQTIEIDTENSLTWYDRQWQSGSPSNWTWFLLHLEKDGPNETTCEKVSLWYFPTGWDNSTKGFATIRQQPGIQHVVPATFEPGNRFYDSPYNYSYPLEWTARLLDGTTLNITTTRDDQELRDSRGLFRTYEGYVEASGTTISGQRVRGFGLVEIQPVYTLPS